MHQEPLEGIPDVLPFYDSAGRAICYLYEREYFYFYDGRPVAVLNQSYSVASLFSISDLDAIPWSRAEEGSFSAR
jgi:4-fold beta-flower domain-containing protein